MKTIRFALVAVLLALTTSGWADDIDIYSGLAGTSNIPNVMITLDNSANNNASMLACTYWDGVVPQGTNTGTKSLDNYMCALDNIAHGLTTRTDGTALVKLGISTQAGIALQLTPVDDNPYTGTYPGGAGKTNRAVLSLAIRALRDNPGSSAQGKTMQETWAYLTGGNGGSTNVGENSGTAWPGVGVATGCQKNFNIFLSGVNAGASHASSTSSLAVLTAAVNNAVGAGTPAATKLLSLIDTAHVSPNKPYGIEWARFMYSTDVNGGATGAQNIVSYSIAAGDVAYPTISNDFEWYVYDIATYGGGKYFAARSYSDIFQYILKILNEVQAVNSVFASSSLPVSVNAQGTYLNQIFMGMFRPDAQASPRWLGNLKQYKFSYSDATQTLTLVDQTGAAALSSAGTGFITPNAISYWTNKDTAVLPDSGGGFWVNQPQSAGAGYDSPDGEVVEKGGVAQVLRKTNLHNDYTAAPGSASNPRNIYTFCPAGSSCNANLTDSTNVFDTSNAAITAGMFNAAHRPVQSIVRTGTTALVTTTGDHGFQAGDAVTISGSVPSDYNVTQTLTAGNINGSTTFTITGLGDNPTTPNTGIYTAALNNGAPRDISTINVATSTTANANACASGTIPNINCHQVQVTTVGNHLYSTGNSVIITGVSPAAYGGIVTITVTGATTFTYNVPVTPTSVSKNAYTVTKPASSPASMTSITKSGTTYTVNMSNSFVNGNKVTISGATDTSINGTYTVSARTASTFVLQEGISGNHPCAGAACGSIVLKASDGTVAIGAISRGVNATSATATMTIAAGNGFANNDTVNLAWASGINTSEGAYAPQGGGNRSVQITCTAGGATPCTTFTFPITVAPSTTTLVTSSPQVALGVSVTIPAGSITRTGATVTVTGVANAFVSGDTISIGASAPAVGSESAYAGSWPITCPVNCSTAFTFTLPASALTPLSPATGTITAYTGTAPNLTSLSHWIRGRDNQGDEKSPDTTYANINVRGSIHGDVLHSRPTVVNYGGTTGIVVYYGANDGMFRAINGNQINPTGSTLPAPGNEMWSFLPTDFFPGMTRQQTASPSLKLPSTPVGILPTPQPKQYFADGLTGIYQEVAADGTTTKAYLYVSVRRGGNFIYALDVSSPAVPKFLWKVDHTGLTTASGVTASSAYAELGQTWSQPKVAFVKGWANPVLIFGAGYDANEDVEPPGTDASGRGIFILDAITGALVWKVTAGASTGCTPAASGVPASCTRGSMRYSIPSDVTLMSTTYNGYIDRLYVGDTGGNVWRVDLEPSSGKTPDNWRVRKLAALGCNRGACSAGTTGRKFFYPPDVIPPTTGHNYYAVLIGSGDREHPLYSAAANNAYTVTNRFYMLKDIDTGPTGSDLFYTEQDISGTPTLKDITPVPPATTGLYDESLDGYYLSFATGEKQVNAATTVAGFTYFGTNTPATPTSDACTTNLGIAKGYAIKPLTGAYTSVKYDGGGLPPTPVAGFVTLTTSDTNVTKTVPFCMGCGGGVQPPGAPACTSGICAGKPPITVPSTRTRQYWYTEGK